MKKLMSLVALAAATLAIAPAALAQTWSVILTGSQETPPVSTTGIGTGTFTLTGNNLDYHVTFNLQGNYTASHIHRAPVGVAGGVIFPLLQSSPGMLMGTINGLTPTQIDDLKSGLWYVNVHSDIFPAGEIRGQIVPEPGTMAAIATGLVGLVTLRRRK